jgi:hypothetical protein
MRLAARRLLLVAISATIAGGVIATASTVLAGEPARSIANPAAPTKSLFGSALTWGDVDGDGVEDLVVSAPTWGVPPDEEERVYVYRGGRDLALTLKVPSAGYEALGINLAVVSDAGHEGGEIVVGAPLAGPNHEGRVYVYSGRTGRLLRTLVSPHTVGFGEFGTSLAIGAGANRRRWIAVGAPLEYFGAHSGRVYLFPVASDDPPTEIDPPSASSNEGFGAALASTPTAHDTSRLFIAAEFEQSAPFVGGVIYAYDASGLHRFAVNPESGLGRIFGASLATGALDEHGEPDLVVGSEGGREPQGRVFVFSGTGSLLATLDEPVPSPGRGFGRSIAVDRVDRRIAVGDPGQSSGGLALVGQVDFFSLDDPTHPQIVQSPTPTASSGFGWSVAFSQCGTTRLAVGAPWIEGGSGSVYVTARVGADFAKGGTSRREHRLDTDVAPQEQRERC